MTETTREAALRPSAADLYPFLPVRMWTAAGKLAQLVAKSRGISMQATSRACRILSEAHFVFRSKGLEPATNG
jgi:hypothetical protein